MNLMKFHETKSLDTLLEMISYFIYAQSNIFTNDIR